MAFDFDGTLADTLESIALCMGRAFTALGLPAPERERVAAAIGIPLTGIIESLLPPGLHAPDLVEHLAERYRQEQKPVVPRLLRLFPGSLELLEALSRAGVLLAVASNKSRVDLELHLELLKIRSYFTWIGAGDDHPPAERKPHPAPLLDLLRDLALAPGELLMVGDTVYDLRMAHAAGCDSAAVAWGCHPRAQLQAEQPTYLVERMEELAGLALPRAEETGLHPAP
jgi:phosphoglycolate phosphatase